jgi:TrmH family RNA methyltransferase
VKITSINNKRILILRKLYKSRERKKADSFLVEGYKECIRGIRSSFEVESVYYCPDIISKEHWNNIQPLLNKNVEIIELDKNVYEKLAYRQDTEGIIALFKKKKFNLEELFRKKKKLLFVILEGVEKPGNLGAVLRTADAVGIDAIFLTETKVDQYHPNVIRASLGGVFTIPVISLSNKEVKDLLTSKKISTYAAALPSYHNMYDLDLKESIALIFGTESTGLDNFWLQNADTTYTIPMQGIVDSLNISVSVAVSIYEVVRQRMV